MHISNAVGGRDAIIPSKDASGRDILVTILKLTYSVGPSGVARRVEDDPAVVDFADTYHGQDGAKSSIRRPSQVFDHKPGTDVVLLGHAHPRWRGGPTSHVDVSLEVGPIRKVVRAYGLRVWQRGGVHGVVPGPARALSEPLPLVYELAWGGMDHTDPMRPRGDTRNYVGRGLDGSPNQLVDQPAARFEDPRSPIATTSNPNPASFGPIHRHWEPRVRYAGTYDERWMQTRMPLLPEDFDPRHHICVPPEQWASSPLRGDEPFAITGATPEGTWCFQLPRTPPAFLSYGPEGRREHRTHLDTILIDADAMRVELTWRAVVPMPRKLEMLERVQIMTKELLHIPRSGSA